jgi:hypothetical protein
VLNLAEPEQDLSALEPERVRLRDALVRYRVLKPKDFGEPNGLGLDPVLRANAEALAAVRLSGSKGPVARLLQGVTRGAVVVGVDEEGPGLAGVGVTLLDEHEVPLVSADDYSSDEFGHIDEVG